MGASQEAVGKNRKNYRPGVSAAWGTGLSQSDPYANVDSLLIELGGFLPVLALELSKCCRQSAQGGVQFKNQDVLVLALTKAESIQLKFPGPHPPHLYISAMVTYVTLTQDPTVQSRCLGPEILPSTEITGQCATMPGFSLFLPPSPYHPFC